MWRMANGRQLIPFLILSIFLIFSTIVFFLFFFLSLFKADDVENEKLPEKDPNDLKSGLKIDEMDQLVSRQFFVSWK